MIIPVAQAQTLGARVWEESLIIPTYELGPPNPLPPLLEAWRGQRRPVYPYPLLDNLTDHRVEKSYRAVYLENEYLRVTVLPELGGHLYAIYDKTAKRDVLYTNHVIKYGMVAIRGAWASGGIEWNFPDGHTLTTVSPVDDATRVEPDGSAVVVVGDTERVQRMQWAVAIRLRPGRKVVETEVTLNNRRETPGRYWFWATAAAPAANDLRFVYPMREAYPHAFWPVFSFPKEKGVDVGTYREVTNALSLFARDSRRDFFGVYYERSDWGVVHVADHREVPGKKTWTWGTDEAGRIWVGKLTEADGQYVEFQAGRFETQMEHELIAPHRVERFTEYWYPVDRLGGGFDEATRDAALRVTVAGGRMRVAVNATAHYPGAELSIEEDGQRINGARIDLTPDAPSAANFALPSRAPGRPLTVLIRSREGRELIRYRTDTPIDGNPDFRPATRPAPDPNVAASAEQSYVAGLAADKKSQEGAARAAYHEALKRDPGFAPAHTALGLSYYRSGEYERAAEHLSAALGRNRDAGDAHYYLGFVRRAQGRAGEAAEHFLWCVRTGHREAVARYALGELALAGDDPGAAIEHLTRAVVLDPRDLKARTLLALAGRVTGRLEEAQGWIDAVVCEMPIDYLALSEQAEIYRARGKAAEAARARAELWRLLAREPDSALELAFDYAAAGRADESRRALEEAIARSSKSGQRAHAMWHYTLGYFYGLGGDEVGARAQYTRGAAADPALVFPHRVEELAALGAARAANPEDGRAAYYLGNVLAAKLRGEEALAAWRDAARLDGRQTVARRNYARALWLVAGKKEEAAAEYDRAVALAPQESALYLERDQLLAEMGASERRLALLEGAPPGVRARPAVAQSLAEAYLAAGRLADAARLIDRTSFVSGEGELSALGLYRRAHLGLAGEHREAGRHAEAAAEILKATEYPANLGVGRPAMQSQAREYVAAARELEAAGRTEEATRWWRRAADEPLNSPTQPDEPWSEHYYFKAFALDRVGRRSEARALYERLAALGDEARMLASEPSPPTGALRFVLAGLGLKGLGREAEARAAFARALQFDPRNERARAALAELEGVR